MKLIPISDYTQSIEPVGYWEPENRYASADDEENEFMDYREDEDLDWMNK